MTTRAELWPHQILLPKHQHWEITEWCETMFGPRWEAIGHRQGTWCVFWAGREQPGHYLWLFKHSADADWFSLRWM